MQELRVEGIAGSVLKLIVLFSLGLTGCQGNASFKSICRIMDQHERYAVNQFVLPAGPQDMVSDIDGDGTKENQFGVFAQSGSASSFFDFVGSISNGLHDGNGVLLIDLISSSVEPGCSAVAFNLAMPSDPPRFDGTDRFQTLLGQPWLTLPARQDGEHIVAEPMAADLSDDPPRLDVFLPVSGNPLHFGVYGARANLHRLPDGRLEGQINGALKTKLIDNALSTIAAQGITQFIHDNQSNDAIVFAILRMFEDQSKSVSSEKCKTASLCCSVNRATCVILPDEFRISGFLEQTLSKDVQVFAGDAWQPVAGGSDKNGTSFGIGVLAVRAEHSPSCPSGTFCRDPRVPKTIPLGVTLWNISGSGYGDVWASGDQGVLLHFNGLDWSQETRLPFGGKLFPLASRSADDAAVALLDTGLAARWNGVSWVPLPTPPRGITRMQIVDRNTLLTTNWGGPGGGGSVNRLQNGIWQLLYESPTGNLLNVQTVGADIWATGLTGALIHSKDGLWQEERVPGIATTQLDAIWGSDSANVWSVGRGACCHWNGEAWETKLDCNKAGNHNGVWGKERDVVWITSTGSVLFLDRRVASPTWISVPADSMIEQQAIWGSGPSEVWAVGADATILRYQP